MSPRGPTPRARESRTRSRKPAGEPGAAAGQAILCLNGGSSSLKFALYRLDGQQARRLAHGAVERIGLAGGLFWLEAGEPSRRERRDLDCAGHEEAVGACFAALEAAGLPAPQAVGHRLVHGGARHTAPERVQPDLLAELRSLVPFAPLHLPGELQVIEAVAGKYRVLPQVACFDTAFHRRMPELTQRLPLPERFWHDGLRRYGFHGLSYEYILQALGTDAAGRVIIAHLGNGASMAAVRGGVPLDTTMGFTPTGGVMMGTRSGDLDPGVLLHLLQEGGLDAGRLQTLLNQESGLLGVSGLSPDMKTLLEARARDPRAALAIDMFCYQLRKQVGAYVAALGGADTLVFTGGIGERAAPIRAAVCQGLGPLGIVLDGTRNTAHADPISTAGSPCTVRVIPTDEDLMIARHTRALIFGTQGA
ncbi:MAG: acetate/propionate family kinase [Candidatus Lambdaproteobacteria bacterium]|nr:acetate/propionate family kinase [Candidatus Lambdaproteobacteria bacterium]